MKKLLSLLLCVAMLAAAMLLGSCADPRAEKYEKALSMLVDKNYAEAKGLFAELGDYKEAEKYLSRFLYIPTLITFTLRDRAGTLTLTRGENNLPILLISAGENTAKHGKLTYDEFGRVIRQEVQNTLTGLSGTYDYTFDERGYLVAAEYLDSTGMAVTYTYEYNDKGQKLLERYTENGEIIFTDTYTYDEQGRWIGVISDWRGRHRHLHLHL